MDQLIEIESEQVDSEFCDECGHYHLGRIFESECPSRDESCGDYRCCQP